MTQPMNHPEIRVLSAVPLMRAILDRWRAHITTRLLRWPQFCPSCTLYHQVNGESSAFPSDIEDEGVWMTVDGYNTGDINFFSFS